MNYLDDLEKRYTQKQEYINALQNELHEAKMTNICLQTRVDLLMCLNPHHDKLLRVMKERAKK
jgi:hypothetical protein